MADDNSNLTDRIRAITGDVPKTLDESTARACIREARTLSKTLSMALPNVPPPRMGEIKAWADRTVKELCRLFDSRRRWRLVNKSWAGNKIPQRISAWIARLYVDSMVLALRRQDDRDRRSVCLRRILTGLRDGDIQLPAPVGGVLDPASDLLRLSEIVTKARDRANRAVAHIDEEGPRHNMTFGELENSLDELADLANPYLLALDVGPAMEPAENWAIDEVYLRRSWLAPEWGEHWREGWTQRIAEHFPRIDFLTVEDHTAVVEDFEAVVVGMDTALDEKTPVSPIRDSLDNSGLPSSDAAVQLVKDLLRERGPNWRKPVEE